MFVIFLFFLFSLPGVLVGSTGIPKPTIEISSSDAVITVEKLVTWNPSLLLSVPVTNNKRELMLPASFLNGVAQKMSLVEGLKDFNFVPPVVNDSSLPPEKPSYSTSDKAKFKLVTRAVIALDGVGYGVYPKNNIKLIHEHIQWQDEEIAKLKTLNQSLSNQVSKFTDSLEFNRQESSKSNQAFSNQLELNNELKKNLKKAQQGWNDQAEFTKSLKNALNDANTKLDKAKKELKKNVIVIGNLNKRLTDETNAKNYWMANRPSEDKKIKVLEKDLEAKITELEKQKNERIGRLDNEKLQLTNQINELQEKTKPYSKWQRLAITLVLFAAVLCCVKAGHVCGDVLQNSCKAGLLYGKHMFANINIPKFNVPQFNVAERFYDLTDWVALHFALLRTRFRV